MHTRLLAGWLPPAFAESFSSRFSFFSLGSRAFLVAKINFDR
jgi:hypothetical protein